MHILIIEIISRVTWDEPLVSNLTNGMKLFTVGLPASGAILTYILNILDRFNFTRDSIADYNRTTLTYHRMIETFKYAYALRNDMGDKEFVDMKEVSKQCNLINKYILYYFGAYYIYHKFRNKKMCDIPKFLKRNNII